MESCHPNHDDALALQHIIATDPLRQKALDAIATLNLPDCWIAAGFVRDAVWDHLHGFAIRQPMGDVDVVWFDMNKVDAAADRLLEEALRQQMPQLDWSVKNQARMHERNGDAPYVSVADAMTHWPETATAIAVRLDAVGAIEINAPFGLEDVFAMRLRPAPFFCEERLSVFEQRVRSKNWRTRYPLLTIAPTLPMS